MAVAFSVLLLLAVGGVEGASYTWGHRNKYASPLYETDVRLHAASHTLDIRYPEEDATSADYTITAMHAFDLRHDEEADNRAAEGAVDVDAASSVQILSGGIGHNYTRVRFYWKPAYLDGLHFRFTVYGVDL